MLGFNITGDEVHVSAHHLEAGVAKDMLQGENVSRIEKKALGEGMAKGVR